MKNTVLPAVFWTLLAVCGMGACATRDAAAEAEIQTRIDSSVNARVNKLQADLQHQNDSLIDAAARRRADSALATGRP